tara:strand:+ start:3483 stop:3620 length:138 start_codon:yes stop_codon:yes gene_type:complete
MVPGGFGYIPNEEPTMTLRQRYDLYVAAMTSLDLPYETFDTWLNR